MCVFFGSSPAACSMPGISHVSTFFPRIAVWPGVAELTRVTIGVLLLALMCCTSTAQIFVAINNGLPEYAAKVRGSLTNA
jgi:hypothetical protein